MTNLTIVEKRALEEVFICLDERKNRRIDSIKKYLMFYKAFEIMPLKRRVLNLKK